MAALRERSLRSIPLAQLLSPFLKALFPFFNANRFSFDDTRMCLPCLIVLTIRREQMSAFAHERNRFEDWMVGRISRFFSSLLDGSGEDELLDNFRWNITPQADLSGPTRHCAQRAGYPAACCFGRQRAVARQTTHGAIDPALTVAPAPPSPDISQSGAIPPPISNIRSWRNAGAPEGSAVNLHKFEGLRSHVENACAH
jgi:hypothetical protein